MSDGMKPAAVDWRGRCFEDAATKLQIRQNGVGSVSIDDGRGNVSWRVEIEQPSPAIHALAALALHGQPFGFSWADVALLERLADYDHREAACLEGHVDDFPEVADNREAHVRALAARIAALLPPE